jgi:hypothetical protein
MFVANGGDTLLVANSGGTNISKVFLADANLANVNEVLSARIKTPNTYIADVRASLDAAGTARFDVIYTDYSDRPQYVAQAINGDIYFSTKPTLSAPDGTLRRYESYQPVPDVEQIYQYGGTAGSGHIAIINADSVHVVGSGAPGVSDFLVICDHTHNMGGTSYCVAGKDPVAIVDTLRTVYGADVVGVPNFDIKSLGLRDTTFVAASGDRQWIAFGEAHTDSAGRVMMVQNPGNFFSPSMNVKDLVNNASERIFGLALNSDGSTAAAHGLESYFFETQFSLHLRLQGKVNTFDSGSGIAFHPDNRDGLPDGDARNTAFVASANGTIEIVDTYHYTSRGTLPVRANLYGPIRVTGRFPNDDPQVILKLFGLTTEGFIVIDVRASDIQPLPSLRRVRR